jgi:hypothetical protein
MGTAAISNGKIVHTGAKELPLKHIYMNSNLIFDCNDEHNFQVEILFTMKKDGNICLLNIVS